MNIYVEGNIGTGKTTFLNFLEENTNNLNIVYEPVDEWLKIKDSTEKNLLEYFYEDQKKWAFPFQMNSFISRINRIDEIKKKNPEKTNIIERSVYTDKNCFAYNCYQMGNMSEIEYNIYLRWHDWLCNTYSVKPSAFIYLRTEPKISNDRIKKRSREGENSIPIDYLTKLHELHETWMETEKSKGVPILYIDCNEKLYDNKSILIEKINTFIKHCQRCEN